jgi:hypothetical protein
MSMTMRALLKVRRELRVVRSRMCRPGGEVFLGRAMVLSMKAERMAARLWR